jgi:hypothetical protein
VQEKSSKKKGDVDAVPADAPSGQLVITQSYRRFVDAFLCANADYKRLVHDMIAWFCAS